MGGLRQERVGGGRTNLAGAGVPPIAGFSGDGGSRPGSAAGSRPGSAGQRRLPVAPLGEHASPGSSGPRSRPTSAPASRPSTGSSGRPRPWPHEDGGVAGDAGQRFARRESGLAHVQRESERGRRDDLFAGSPAAGGDGLDSSGGSRAGSRVSSRPGTANSRASRASGSGGREGLPPRAARPMSAPVVRKKEESRPATADSETSEACEERLLTFQKYFQDKNFAKFSLLKDAFRAVDKDKNGVLGPDEVAEAMASLDIPVDKRIVHRLMSRCDNPQEMTIQDFKSLLWVDDTMETYIDDRKNRRAGGQTVEKKYLWTRIKPKVDSKFIGSINDTLEADKRDTGRLHPRLDYNFSSVSYDILSFGERNYEPPREHVSVPVKSRPRFFDAPAPAGRRVAYDRGDTPYNITSLESPRIPSSEVVTTASNSYAAPVRIVTFARVQASELPTQQGHMLSKTVV